MSTTANASWYADLEEVERDLAVAEQRSAAEVEEVDARLLHVPEVPVEHVAVRELAGAGGEQRLVAGERQGRGQQPEQRDDAEDRQHLESPAPGSSCLHPGRCYRRAHRGGGRRPRW